jgi:hypothetical protein
MGLYVRALGIGEVGLWYALLMLDRVPSYPSAPLFRQSLPRSTLAIGLRSLHEPKSPALSCARVAENGTLLLGQKDGALSDPANRARTLGVAPFGAPLRELGRRDRKERGV